jgi:hypothetical protein
MKSLRSTRQDLSVAQKQRAKRFEDIALKWLPMAALVVGGIWTFYHWYLGGADNWMVNMDMTTEVLPYKDDLRLLVIHTKTMNPTSVEVVFKKHEATFTLTVREVSKDLPPESVIDPDVGSGRLIKAVDLMPDGKDDEYGYIPNANFDDTRGIVLKVGTVVSLSAELTRGDDFVSVNRIVRVQP